MNTEPQRLGKYELRERLGRGGMAEVWKAFDTQLRRYVAIKILHADLQNDPSFITRFEREAQVIASLHHPNIVQIHDFQISRPPESSSTIAYMVMDYVEGETLADYIRSTSRQGKFPPAADIVHLFTAISKAIDYAHQKGMIHRDIKPANILLDKRQINAQYPMGDPILTDFGIVKLMGASTGTMSGMWLGTPLYISPEQAQGHPGNERSDIYSLGVILYEICTGVQPFHGETITAIMMQHISSMPTSPSLINPNIPPALTMVILRCLAKDPGARFPSAASLTAALAEAFNLPVPAELNLPTYPMEEMYGPTRFAPFQSGLAQEMTPSSASWLAARSAQAQPVALSTPQLSSAPSAGRGTPVIQDGTQATGSTPINSAAGPAVLANGAPNTLATTPTGSSREQATSSSNKSEASPAVLTPAPSTKPPGRNRGGMWMRVGLIVLILLVLGGGLSAILLLTHPHTTPPVTTSQTVGYVQFITSGQGYADNNIGLNDELQINLQHISNPAPGKAYYGWLLGDTDETPPLILGNGPLPLSQGNIDFLFQGDAQHSDLLATYSRFLITQESTSNPPTVPDYTASGYSASIPRTPNPADKQFHFSMLDHIRHLLSDEQTIKSIGLQGGLSIWFLRNTEEVFKWSISAKDHWQSQNATSIRQQLINILYYLDGAPCIEQDLHTVPPGTLTTPENPTIASIGRVALIEPCAQHKLGYVRHIGAHLLGVATSPGATQATRDAATQIDHAINDVKAWLEQLRVDAVQLVDMSDAQLIQQPALSKLGDLATLARYAYAGRIDPATGIYHGGVIWIYGSTQRLAVFNVAPCTGTVTSCV